MNKKTNEKTTIQFKQKKQKIVGETNTVVHFLEPHWGRKCSLVLEILNIGR